MSQAVTKEDWKRIQDRLSERVGEDLFRMHLRNTLLCRLEPSILEVGVPNLIVADYLQAHYADAIIESTAETVGFKPKRIKFSVNGHLFRKLRESQKPMQEAQPAGTEEPRSFVNVTVNGAPARQNARIFSMNERYRLDNFVVGPNSKLAFNGAVDVSRAPGGKYPTLFIYGGTGLGKTHLLQGIARQVEDARRWAKVLYVSGEYFVNQYLMALKLKAPDAFRQRFRQVDVLVIDDVQFFAGKVKCQDELLHTLKVLEIAGKQVVCAADRHPKELEDFSEQMVSRFVAGMVAELRPPNSATRTSIIKSKLAGHRDRFPDSTVSFLSQKLDGSVRELEGSLTQLIALAGMNNEKITVSLAQEALKSLLAGSKRLIELPDIENVVIGHFGVSSEDLHGRSRERSIALARQVCMYLARRLTQHSLKEIGTFFGNKNHTTVVFAAQKIEKSMDDRPELKGVVERLRRQLSER